MTIISVSGVRGVAGRDLTPAFLVELGSKFGCFIDHGRCLIARDTRHSGSFVADAVMAGLLKEGCVIYDVGVASTPAIFREVVKKGFDGGLSVTASHNPPEWNGVKFVVKGGRGLFQEELKELLAMPQDAASFKAPGMIVHSEGVGYVEDLISYAGGEGSLSGLSVAVDLGGGAGCSFVPQVFHRMGCRVFTVNGEPGVFNRALDPTVDSLTSLSESVVRNGCSVGFAYDCDVDRVVVVNEDGLKLPPDLTLAICLRQFLREAKVGDVVASVDTSLMVEDVASSHGVLIHYAPVGEVNVVKRMMELGCKIGGEGSSGGVIMSDFSWCRDGVLASLLLAEEVRRESGLKEIVKGLPRYVQRRHGFPCDRARAERLMEALASGSSGVDRTDGVKLKTSEKSWVLVRCSGTEDLVRVSVEAESEAAADQLMERYSSLVLKMLEV